MNIEWTHWHAGAFERAHVERKPVLLSIGASWCSGCHEMDRVSFADPEVVRLVNARFVAVRVDADRRPDLDVRYNLGGLPTTAFLTADGAIVGGGTFAEADRLREALQRVVEAFASGRHAAASRPGPADVRPGQAAPGSFDAVLASIFETYDPQHGGFGTAPKFPLTAPLHLALTLDASAAHPDLRATVECTLDAMATRGLYDPVDGGFFRCAATRDWRMPHQEKLLDVNAALLRVFIDGAVALDAARYVEPAAAVVRYAQTWLADAADGAWAGSQCADATYYAARTREARAAMEPPAIDRTFYSDWNAAMISAALHAAHVMQDAGLAEFAITSLERLLVACYQPGGGVAHYFDGSGHVRGLLDDQIAMAAAALDAAEATGRVPYAMMAEELALYALRAMWDDEGGGLFDRAPAPAAENVGLLTTRLKPFVSNCEAARLFTRLAASSGNHEFAERARETIASMAPRAAAEGPLAAHYLLAVCEAGLR